MCVYITVVSEDGRGVGFTRMYVYITVVSEDGRGVGFTRMYVYITVVSEDGVGGVRFHWDVCLHYCF